MMIGCVKDVMSVSYVYLCVCAVLGVFSGRVDVISCIFTIFVIPFFSVFAIVMWKLFKKMVVAVVPLFTDTVFGIFGYEITIRRIE